MYWSGGSDLWLTGPAVRQDARSMYKESQTAILQGLVYGTFGWLGFYVSEKLHEFVCL